MHLYSTLRITASNYTFCNVMKTTCFCPKMSHYLQYVQFNLVDSSIWPTEKEKDVIRFSPFEQDAGEGALDALSDLVVGLRGS